ASRTGNRREWSPDPARSAHRRATAAAVSPGRESSRPARSVVPWVQPIRESGTRSSSGVGRFGHMPSYLTRQIVTAALAANAVKPLRGRFGSVPSFAAGWLTSELAPHLLALTTADTALELTRRRRKGTSSGRLGLIAAGTAAGTLGYLVFGARTTATGV